MVQDKVTTKLLKKLLNAGSVNKAARVLERIHPADVAALMGSLNPYQIRSLIGAMFSEKRVAWALTELPEELLVKVLSSMKTAEIADILRRLQPDDAALLVNHLGTERRKAVLDILPAGTRFEVKRLLAYPDGTAGSVMTTRFIAVGPETTVAEGIAEVRRRSHEMEALSYLYVIDGDGRLIGVVSLRELLINADSAPSSSIMVQEPIAANALDDQESVSKAISRYDLLSIPVVNDDGVLVGIVTVDDAIDVIYEEATADMYKMAGLSEGDRVFSPIHETYLKRIPWTMINLCTAFAVAWVVGIFEVAIKKSSVLAIFMPVVAGMGGNCGSQTLTVITRGLALDELDWSSAWQAILKQVTVGLLIGMTAGLLTAGIAWLWRDNVVLGLILFLAMTVNMILGGLMGASVPLILKLLRLDPALGSGILVTAITDAFGFFTFLGLATLLMSHLL